MSMHQKNWTENIPTLNSRISWKCYIQRSTTMTHLIIGYCNLYEPTITTGVFLAEGTNFLNNHIVQIQNIEYIFSGLGSLMTSHCLNADLVTSTHVQFLLNNTEIIGKKLLGLGYCNCNRPTKVWILFMILNMFRKLHCEWFQMTDMRTMTRPVQLPLCHTELQVIPSSILDSSLKWPLC